MSSDLQVIMRFLVDALGDPVSGLIGPRGRELEYLIPEGVEWDQVGYGQGEGQVRMEGCEWGIYWESARRLSLQLESGQVEFEVAAATVRRIADKVFGVRRYTLQLVSG